jgi:hypothetical protein
MIKEIIKYIELKQKMENKKLKKVDRIYIKKDFFKF